MGRTALGKINIGGLLTPEIEFRQKSTHLSIPDKSNPIENTDTEPFLKMNSLVSKLLPNSAAMHAPSEEGSSGHVFSFRQSPSDSNCTVIQPMGTHQDAPPMYSIIRSKHSKPNVVVFAGDRSSHNMLGDARFSSLSSKTKLTLRGQPLIMKRSELTGNFTVDDAHWGKLKWHTNQLTGRSLELRDRSGQPLARLKALGFPGSGQKKLEILVPFDKQFLDMVVLTGAVAKALEKTEVAELVEVFGGI